MRKDKLIEHWAALRQRKDELERDLDATEKEIIRTEGRIAEYDELKAEGLIEGD